MHFHAIFKSFSLILQADFFFLFFFISISGGRGFENCWGNILLRGHSLPPTDSRRAVVSFWRKNVHCTVKPLMYKPAEEVRLCKLTGSKIT